MRRFLVIGAVALDRPIRLEGALRGGARLRARSLLNALEGRLGGGGANAGCALLAAGHAVLVATLLADDPDGRQTRALAQAAGLDLALASTRPGTSSQTLVLLEPTGERTIISLDGSTPDARARLVPVSDHLDIRPDGVFVRSAYEGSAEWALTSTGPVILHWPAPAYDGAVDVVVASAEDLPDSVAATPFARAAARFGPRLSWVVITHGAAGAVAYGRDGVRFAAKPPPVDARDATGAGDVFAAGLLDALAGGAPMDKALEHACIWGAAAAALDSSAPVEAPTGTFNAWSGQTLAQLS